MIGGFRTLRLSPKQQRTVSSGFTIVETMIVIAITGVLFVSLVTTVSGKQNKVRFQQSVNEIKSQLEQVVNETQSGYFPSNANFGCSYVGLGLKFTGPATAQGENKQCVFLGKVLQFSNVAYGTDPEKYAVYTIAGRNSASSPMVSNFQSSSPTVVNLPAGLNEVTEYKALQNGLSVGSIKYGATNVGAIGFLTYFSSRDGVAFGTQTAQVVPIKTRLDDTSIGNISKINNMISTAYQNNRNPSTGVTICFEGGATGQTAYITIGGAGGPNSVKLEIKNNQDCP